MMNRLDRHPISKCSIALVAISLCVSCTRSSVNQFKLLPTGKTVDAGFVTGKQVVQTSSVPVDILWVIDNSDSMASSQTALKAGFADFAEQYLTQSGTDVQMAVATTDTFVANEAWERYLNTVLPGFGKAPKDYHPAKGDMPGYGPDYAKLPASALIRTKGSSSSQLEAQFQKLASVGIDGIYEERGFGSVNQFLSDNEAASRPAALHLFRKGSQRIIVFLSDEDDQSIDPSNNGPEPRKLLFHGSYYVGKDPKVAAKILPPHFSINCPTSVVEGVTLAPLSICVDDSLLLPVATFKTQLDTFFQGLDGTAANANPNYFIVTITGKDLKTIQKLRDSVEKINGVPKEITHERGNRYIELVDQTANGSFSMDIGITDYKPVLDKIGLEVVHRSTVQTYKPQTVFRLERAADPGEPAVVTLISGSSSITLDPSQYTVSAHAVELIDATLIATLKPGDEVHVNYQPNEVVPSG